jgi:uncharacterized membrane protein YraQ (UPF0718 family)
LFDGTLWMMLAVLGVLCALAYQRGGSELLGQGLSNGAALLLRFGLLIAVSFLAAGLAEKLLPEAWLRSALGPEAGVGGLLIATGAGVVTPAGPFVSMPVAAVMLRSGAAPPAVVAYLTAWSLLALQRFVAWEVPILGLRFALLRYGACVAVPFVVGLLVRLLLRP